MNIEEALTNTPAIPVLSIARAEDAVPLARALVAGGLKVLEITLRTQAAVEAMRRIGAEVEEAIVGAGTVTQASQIDAVRSAGARFFVSPGLTPRLAAAARDSGLPFLPGVTTTTEAMHAREEGFRVLKLFPASLVGGPAFLKAIGGPLPDLRFCPTGGIDAQTYRDYLSLANVLCVGGSWMAPKDIVAARDWARITQLASEVRR